MATQFHKHLKKNPSYQILSKAHCLISSTEGGKKKKIQLQNFNKVVKD